MARKARLSVSNDFIIAVGTVFVLFVLLFSLPFIFAWKGKYEAPQARLAPFTVTVNPQARTITEDPEVEATLSAKPLSAAVANVSDVFEKVSEQMSQSSVYLMLAGVGTPQFVMIDPGLRKEEIAVAFGTALGWDKETQSKFLSSGSDSSFEEGNFSPGLYAVTTGTTVADAGLLAEERFKSQILSRYGTSTEEIVPLSETLNIASMIQRETGDKQEMRLISGIIWNRIFNGMPLQLDATLQYAKASAKKGKITDWWPVVYPKDKYIKSPYNTYQNAGLPPTAIANPSVSAVIAALNPKNTDCLFYFHDKNGDFHCSNTYEEHVALLKKFFGRGK